LKERRSLPMTRFLHITDLHVTASDPDTSARLADLLARAALLTPKPAFIVASGDLTDNGDQASYEQIATCFSASDIPVLMTLGNHDARGPWHTVFPGHPAAPDGPVDFDQVIAGIHVVLLDSSVPGKTSGAFDADQIKGAEERLSRHPDLPKIVVTHHPPLLEVIADFHWASLDQSSTDQLAALLKPYDIAALLVGHIHMNRTALWHHVPVLVNVGLQASIDASRRDVLSIVEGTGFTICDLLPSGIQCTHVPLGEVRQITELSPDIYRAFQ